MTNEQLNEIVIKAAGGVGNYDTSETQFIIRMDRLHKFARRLLAEVQKLQEPVAWLRSDELRAVEALEKAAFIEQGISQVVSDYTIPLYKALEITE